MTSFRPRLQLHIFTFIIYISIVTWIAAHQHINENGSSKRPNSIRGLHSNNKITLIAVICNVRYRREMITNAVVGNFLSNTKHNKLRSPQNLPDMCIQSDFILNDIWISNKNSKKIA